MSTLDTGSQPESLLARFGLSEFRSGQQQVIDTVLAGRDCLCVMPTGGGKSLCYQLPALALPGVTLVVSPLIALMKDQVDQLQARGISVSFINSTLTVAEQHQRLDDLAAGRFKLVYVVPERFRSPRFLDAVRQAQLSLLAVDEAHCISEWGHDFRPDYARLGHFRRQLGRPTTIALTATATDAVRRDIVEQLDLHEPKTFITGFARPNLFYEVRMTRGEVQRQEELIDVLRKTNGPAIIYAATRKRTEEVAEVLVDKLRRPVAIYHAGMQPDARRVSQDAFIGGQVDTIVATTAFGMGIDKRDVRLVLHYNLPGTIEAYYQEAGRAGRDGLPSRCVLLFQYADRNIQEYFIESAYPAPDNVAQVYDYLCRQPDDVIQKTQQEIKESLHLPIGNEGVGTCEQLLEGAGVVERLVAAQNMASVRIDSDMPTLVDYLPRQAKVRRRVLAAIEQIVGQRRNELVYFRSHELVQRTELDHESVANALRELNQLDIFSYVPPFRGRAIRVLKRNVPFDELGIDFAELEKRKQGEYEKLSEVVRFATSSRCRQRVILNYFGDPAAGNCGHCDNCGSQSLKPNQPSGELPPAAVTTIRVVLSGVARIETQTRCRCGKNLVAQMLCGSLAAKVKQLKLHKLSTFGRLSHMTQADAVRLIDLLISASLLEQVEIGAHRPVVQLTEAGRQVMSGKQQGSLDVPMPADLRQKISIALPGTSERATPQPTVRPAPFPAEDDTDEEIAPPTTEELQATARQASDSPTPAQPAHYWTWRLVQEGFSLVECAAIRRLDRIEIIKHLLEAVGEGRQVPVERLLPAEVLREAKQLESSPKPLTDLSAEPGGELALLERELCRRALGPTLRR